MPENSVNRYHLCTCGSVAVKIHENLMVHAFNDMIYDWNVDWLDFHNKSV